MARKRKGNPVHGWLIVDKPAGVTSSTIVNKLRWLLNAQKAGHAGTLDPDATGLLAVAFGEATKTIPYLTDALKTYEFTVVFGTATSTDDASGEPLRTSQNRPSEAEILDALPNFRGDIQQVPPQVSAVKVDGHRAYDLVRDGDVLALAPRPLFVDRLDLLSFNGEVAKLTMTCGKGGYVRSIARDLGNAVGSFAHVGWLRRTQSGPFTTQDALLFSNWVDVDRGDAGALNEALLPPQAALVNFPSLKLDADGSVRVSHGNQAAVIEAHASDGDIAAAFDGDRLLAIGRYQSGLFTPDRVLNL